MGSDLVDHYTHFTKEVVANLTANLPQLEASKEPAHSDAILVDPEKPKIQVTTKHVFD